jgi:hypothetical protein
MRGGYSGFGFFIPEPGFRDKKAPDLGSGSATKNCRVFNPKFLISSLKYDLGC